MQFVLDQLVRQDILDLDAVVLRGVLGIVLGLLTGLVWPTVTCVCHDRFSKTTGALSLGWLLILFTVPTYMLVGGLLGFLLPLR